MAEVGIIASALQIADIGVRLSLRLYTLGKTVASADKSISSISKDVSQTSAVLQELGQTLVGDQTSRICSPFAVKKADSIVKECQTIFQEMDHLLVKKFPNTRSAEKEKGRRARAALTLERLRWPFIKGRIELLTSSMEQQKSTLVLMLNVIALARHKHEQTEPPTFVAEQRSLIQDLARSNEEFVRRFEQLTFAPLDDSLPTPEVLIAQENSAIASATEASQSGPSTRVQESVSETNDKPENLVLSKTCSRDRLGRLLQQYRTLESALLEEVSAQTYEITEESRSRIKADIVVTHEREVTQLFQTQHSEAPRLNSYTLSGVPLSSGRRSTKSRIPAPIPPKALSASDVENTHSSTDLVGSGRETPASRASLGVKMNFLRSDLPPEKRKTIDYKHRGLSLRRFGVGKMKSPRPPEPQDIVPRNESHDDTSEQDAAEEELDPFEDDTDDDWIEDVVDYLLATLTNVPTHKT